MTIIDRVRSVVAQRTQSAVAGAVTGKLPGLLGTAVAGAITRGIAGGVEAAKASLPAPNQIPELILGEVSRRQSAAVQKAARRVEEQLGRQAAGRLVASVPGLSALTTPVAIPAAQPPTEWTPAPLYGGLTLERYRQLFVESAMTERAWKNLFFVSIEELSPSQEAPGGPGPINLLAVDVGFSPCTMPGDMVPIGGANLDSLTQTERVELRLSTLDDARGSLKRWFVAKADQVAHVEGTMGVPAEYLVAITVTHMAPDNAGDNDQRLRHKWLMRPSNIEIELSRRAPELEELQMSFVQFDTFMLPR